MTHLAHIGNSLGVRIPKTILIQVGFDEKTELEFKITQDGLLLSPVRQCREGWAKAFHNQKTSLLMGDKIANKFDQDEWEW